MMDSSFFFTNFPPEYAEKNLRKVFQRWGRVLDVFIPRRLDVRIKRFGFVRIHGVRDVEVLERKLGSVWIGYWKLQVNKPKCG